MSAPDYPQPGAPGSTPGEYNNPNPQTNTGATNVLGPSPGQPASVTVGSPSNVTSWIPDILTMIQEASERASVPFKDAYSLRSAKRSLDFLSMDWMNKGLNLWTIDERTIPLVNGTAVYSLPPDTVDVVFPVLTTTYTSSGYSFDTPIVREDFETYASIPNKSQQGRPSVIYVTRGTVNPTATMWLVPNSNSETYVVTYWAMRRCMNTGYATNIMDLPFRAMPAMVSGLAWQLATKAPKKDYNLILLLKSQYDEFINDLKMGDSDKSDNFQIYPICYGGGWGSC